MAIRRDNCGRSLWIHTHVFQLQLVASEYLASSQVSHSLLFRGWFRKEADVNPISPRSVSARSYHIGITTTFGDLCPILCDPLRRAAEVGARREVFALAVVWACLR